MPQLKLRAANKARQRLTRPSNHYWRRVKKHVAESSWREKLLKAEWSNIERNQAVDLAMAQYRNLFERRFDLVVYFNGAEMVASG